MGTPKMNRPSARIGYARVSTADQNLDAQMVALEAAGCTMIRTETGDGASLAGRPELGTILEFIHPGETLVVTRIDRLARSMRDLQVIVATLKDKGAHLAATEQPVDTSTAAGKAFFDMLGVFAEFETNLRRERQAEGIAAAKQRGAYRGRPPGSTWKPSGIGWPWACRRRKSLASWGSRAEPSTRPGRAARDEGRQIRVRTRERCHPSRGVTPSARLFELRSARCSYMHGRVCTFGPFGPFTSWPRRPWEEGERGRRALPGPTVESEPLSIAECDPEAGPLIQTLDPVKGGRSKVRFPLIHVWRALSVRRPGSCAKRSLGKS